MLPSFNKLQYIDDGVKFHLYTNLGLLELGIVYEQCRATFFSTEQELVENAQILGVSGEIASLNVLSVLWQPFLIIISVGLLARWKP